MNRFWNSEAAGPSLWDVVRVWDRSPRYLRESPRPRPAPLSSFMEPLRLGPADAAAVTSFWSQHYRGKDWVFRPSLTLIQSALNAPLALGVKEAGTLVGTIVCSWLGPIRLGSHILPELYVIEGLCVAESWRGRHLAGWLIAWVDHLMNAQGPQAFLWSRESPFCTDISHICSHSYGYAFTEDLKGTLPLTSVAWPTFVDLWAAKAPTWTAEQALIPTSLLPSLSSSLSVWQYKDWYVVVANTHRVSVPEGRAIWEVVWCGSMDAPFEGVPGLVLESLQLPKAILFGSSAPHQGDLGSKGANGPWKVGTAGVHTTYIYNFMPPAFQTLRVFLPRIDL